MLNVNQLTAQLAQLSDQALQQYAQAHKEDPYGLSLAVSESQRRKALRAAAQRQQSAPQNGTVVDEAVGEMGGITAGVQDMDIADGGIAGYADGGYVDDGLVPDPEQIRAERERYRYVPWMYREGKSPYVPRSGERDAAANAPLDEQAAQDRAAFARWAADPANTARKMGAASADALTLIPRGLAGAYDTAVARPLRAAGIAAPYISKALVPEGVDPSSMTPFYDKFIRKNEPAPAVASTSAEGMRNYVPRQPQGPVRQGATSTSEPAGGGIASAVRTSSKTGAAAPATPNTNDLDAYLKQMQEQGAAVTKAEVDTARGALDEFDAEAKARTPFAQEREQRLRGEDAEIAGKKADAKSMALIQAGLAILSADPSKGALSAIGEGALKGVGAYKGDIEKLEARRQAVLDKIDDISEMRRQEQMAEGKERRQLRVALKQAENSGARMTFDLMKDAGLPVKLASAKMTFEAQQKAMDRASNEKIAGMRIAAASSRAGGGGGALKPAQYLQAIDREAKRLADSDPVRYFGNPTLAREEAKQLLADQGFYMEGTGVESRPAAGPARPSGAWKVTPE